MIPDISLLQTAADATSRALNNLANGFTWGLGFFCALVLLSKLFTG